jgi:hypothetical protein
MKTILPNYKLPSRSWLTKMAVPAMYAAAMGAISEHLSTVKWGIWATTDFWHCEVNSVQLLSFTVAFISKDMKFR